MKKLILIALTSILTACNLTTYTYTDSSSKSTSTSHKGSSTTQTGTSDLDRGQFVGKWACETDGGSVGTSNKVILNQNGKTDYVGQVTVPKNEPMFQYEVQRTGTWSLTNDVLSYIFTNSNVQRANTPEMLRTIKTSADINAAENEFFAELKTATQNSNGKPVNMVVSDFTGDAFKITQKNRFGHCVRVTD